MRMSSDELPSENLEVVTPSNGCGWDRRPKSAMRRCGSQECPRSTQGLLQLIRRGVPRSLVQPQRKLGRVRPSAKDTVRVDDCRERAFSFEGEGSMSAIAIYQRPSHICAR